MLRSTMLYWNPAHVATRRFRNSSVSWIGTRYNYKRSCNIEAQLHQPHLRWACSNNQREVLPRRVADAEATICNPRHCWICVCLPARQCASTSCSWHSWASAPRDSSSVLTCGQPTVLTSTRVITTSGAWRKCIEYQSATIRTSYGSILVRHGLNFNTAWWTMQLISGEKDWKHDIRAEGGHFEHLLWRCLPDIPVATHHSQFFSEPPMPTHTGCFQSHKRFEECNTTFTQMKKFCILQASAVTFFTFGG